MKYRIEYDSIGKIKVPGDKYWGASTQRSNKYFNIGDFLVRPIVIHSIAIVKKAAAIVNAQNSQLDKRISKYIVKASEEVIQRQAQQVMMPRWLSGRVKDIWLLQYCLENYNPKKSNELLSNPRFRMAYDFFVLRSETIDQQHRDKAEYWTNIQK